ncbi:uncharacterized protein LOC142603764 [Balearica regulorum gibbericeps]|uniref:uncharacterized protein LOC142603764 n=1 Tax=Balearica regulorum gibbericeps TaxID=100784 RepID=UPI003F5E41E8
MKVFNKKPNPLNREKKTNKKRSKQKKRSGVSARGRFYNPPEGQVPPAPPGRPARPADPPHHRELAAHGRARAVPRRPEARSPRRGLAAGPGQAGAPGGRGSLFSRKVRRNSRRRSPSPHCVPRAARTRVTAAGRAGGGGSAASPPPRLRARAVPRLPPSPQGWSGPAPPKERGDNLRAAPRGTAAALPPARAPPGAAGGSSQPQPAPPAAAQEGSPERPQGAGCPPPRPVPLGARAEREGGTTVTPFHASPVPRTTRAPPPELRGCCRPPAARGSSRGQPSPRGREKAGRREQGLGSGAHSPARDSPRRAASPALCTPETAAPPPGAGEGPARGRAEPRVTAGRGRRERAGGRRRRGAVSFLPQRAICDGDHQWHLQSTVFLFCSKSLAGETGEFNAAVKWIYLGISRTMFYLIDSPYKNKTQRWLDLRPAHQACAIISSVNLASAFTVNIVKKDT